MSDYKWDLTPQINQYLIELEAIKLNFASLTISPLREENLRKTALLKSSVYSVRIEGFPDTVTSPKLESQNLLRAYNLVYSKKAPKKLTLKFIRRLHQFTLNNISYNAGKWRTEEWGIFNEAGVAVYKAPPHFQIADLMIDYSKFINKIAVHAGVKAAVAQFVFEKIHPFADGNGRAGRLISTHILNQSGLSFRGLAPFEQYIDEHRNIYYETLEPSHKITDFIDFFLEALVTQCKQILNQISQSPTPLPEDDLPPRHMEILRIIRDHPYSSFDFLQRRFMDIKPGTLHYDLTQLTKQKFIRKIRKTRAATYLAAT